MSNNFGSLVVRAVKRKKLTGKAYLEEKIREMYARSKQAHKSRLCKKGIHTWCYNRNTDETRCKCRCHVPKPKLNRMSFEAGFIAGWQALRAGLPTRRGSTKRFSIKLMTDAYQKYEAAVQDISHDCAGDETR